MAFVEPIISLTVIANFCNADFLISLIIRKKYKKKPDVEKHGLFN
jgi:hypothetical protein